MGFSLYNRIQQDLTAKIKGKDDPLGVSVLRLVIAAVKNKAIAKGSELNDEEVIAILKKSVKERNDSIEMYEKAGRIELADKEKQEIPILSSYLPISLSKEEIATYVAEAIKNHPEAANDPNKGKYFGVLMKEVMNKATTSGKMIDGAIVSALLKEKL